MSVEPASVPLSPIPNCDGCGAELASGLLYCPACHRLVHTDRLKILAEAAESAERGEDLAAALAAWREALSLLPTGTRQYTVITERIASLGRRVDARPSRSTVVGSDPFALPSTSATPSTAADESAKAGWSARTTTGVLGTLALAAWKFKFVTFLILGKAKLLLLGLTKMSTFLSMFAMVGVYWTRFGFWFALGLVLSIYVHEMGHVAALARYGVAASAPCSYLAWAR